MKQQTSDVIAREALLPNLKECNGNVSACARRMRCSPHTVYRALRKREAGHLADLPHTPQTNHPRHTPKKVEDVTAKLPTGASDAFAAFWQPKSISLSPESTIGKVLSRDGRGRMKRKRPSQARPPRYHWEELYPFPGAGGRRQGEPGQEGPSPRGIQAPLKALPLPACQWRATTPVTRIRFLSFSPKKDRFCFFCVFSGS